MTTNPQGASADAEDGLRVERAGEVLLATIDRPQARNALTFATYRRLERTIRSVEDDSRIRVVVITGAGGKAFASGTDISEFAAFRSSQQAIDYERSIGAILDVVERCSVPTIAAIGGVCTGGGLAIAACCDLRIATADSRFGLPMARTLGNCLSLTSHARLAGLLGAARLRDMILTARLLDAAEMRAAGMLTEVVDDPAALMERAMTLARTVAGHAPLTMRVTRESLRALQPPVDESLEEELILKAYLSEDFAEGVDAFLNRRKPTWRGR